MRALVLGSLVALFALASPRAALADTCGAMGGDECMQTGSCPPGYEDLGPSEDCLAACCRKGPSCGQMGGDECMQAGPCPNDYVSLGPSWDCPSACCDYVDPGPTCVERGGEFCGWAGDCGVNHESIGASSDCDTCCRRLPTCGSLAGPEAQCGQHGSCPPNSVYFSRSGDCNPCCKTVPPPATDDAQVLAADLPAAMTCGGTYAASVTMRNAGTTTWTNGGGYKLGTVGDQDPLYGATRVYLPDGVSVAPGGSYTFHMTLTAPPSAGTPYTDWGMVREGVHWFGAVAASSVSVTCAPQPTDNAQVASVNLPTAMNCGAAYAASITMTNTGTTTWTRAGEYKLGTVGDQDFFYPETRVYLPEGASVAPGASHTFTMTLTAPAGPGDYPTDWRMVHDGVAWFGATVTRSVSVTCAPADGDDAQVVSADLPPALTCGETYEASVTMRNTGSTTWTTAGEYKLGAVDDSDPFFPGTRVYLPDGVSVAPGAQHTFRMILTGPADNTTRITDWRMVHDGVGWFGATASRSVTVTCLQPGDHADVVAKDLPPSMLCSATRPSSITLRNTGTTTWWAGQYELGALDGSDPFVPAGAVALTSDVPPAGTYTFSMTLTAPGLAGPYVTDWQMRRVGAAGFGDVVTQPVNVECQQSGDAAMVTDINIPFAFRCGETRSASVTMMNTGTTTWRRDGRRPDGTLQVYRLGAGGNSDPLTTVTRVGLGQGVTVPPGSSHTFPLTLTGPATDGVYTTDWQMVIDDGDGGSSWFGGLALRNVVVACQDLDDADLFGNNLPSTLAEGQSYEAYVIMHNIGTTTWKASDLYRLGAVDDSDPFTTQTRIELSEDVAPGDRETFRFTLVGTGSPGTTDWQMVHDGVGWFGAKATKSVSASGSSNLVDLCPTIDATAKADSSGQARADVEIQKCIDGAPDAGTVRIPAGTYRIDKQLRIKRRVLFGTAAPSPPGDWVTTNCYEGAACARLVASSQLNDFGGILLVDSGEGQPTVRDVTLDHIVLDGGRGGRANTFAAQECAAGRKHAPNATFYCVSCNFTYSVSRDALCASGLIWVGAQATIHRSVFLRNGDFHTNEMWADGLTLLHSDQAVVTENQFINNSDIGMVTGGARDGRFFKNRVSNTAPPEGQPAFGGLMLDNFANSQPGDFTGAVIGGEGNGNTVDCGNQWCNFGINLGPHPWYLFDLEGGQPNCAEPVRNIVGGVVTHNTVVGAKLGLNVDGAGADDNMIEVHHNDVTGSPDRTDFHLVPCSAAYDTSNFNYYRVPEQGGPAHGDSWVNTGTETLPDLKMRPFHSCSLCVCNQLPTASAGPSRTGVAGQAVTFDGSASSDAEGTLTFDWDFGDNTPHGQGARPTHVYATQGTYTVRLTVRDTCGATAGATTTATIEPNRAPTVSVTTAGTCGNGCTVTFTSVASDPEGEALTRAWSGCATGTGVSASCAKGSSGSVAATVTVTDPAGNPASASASVPVYAASYTTGAWSACAGTGTYTCTSATPTGCSRPGTQTRTVSEASWTLNPAGAVPVPATSQACTQTTQGYVASYYVGPWGACSRSCGGGTQTRTVYANAWKSVAPSVAWPGDTQSCNTQPCQLTCYDYPTCYPTKSECYGAGWSVCEIRYRDDGVGGLLTCWKGF